MSSLGKACPLIILLNLLLGGLSRLGQADLVWSTFLGGGNLDCAYGIDVDAEGQTYITGYTESNDFPFTSGSFDTTLDGISDIYVAKINPLATALVYLTFLGGSDYDHGLDIAVDRYGNSYVTGYSKSTDFPTTPGAFDETHNGGRDLLVAKINTTGDLLHYATFLGGNYYERGFGVAVDDSGNAYLTGETESADFPVTTEAFDRTHNGYRDVFVVKLNAEGEDLAYATFLGASGVDWGRAIAVDAAGNAYVTGHTVSEEFPTTALAFDKTYGGQSDAFVARLSTSGNILDYATFLGGGGQDYGYGVAVDGDGNAHVTGSTSSPDFPASSGAFDGTYNDNADVFVTKLNTTGRTLDFSTFLGGSSFERAYDIAADDSGYCYVTGETWSVDFPVSRGAFDKTFNGGVDVFLSKIGPRGNAVFYSSFMGGSSSEYGEDIAVQSTGYVYLAGRVHSDDFPTTSQAFRTQYAGQGDGFVAKFHPVDTWPLMGSPQTCLLCQNYPNPFNGSTRIRYGFSRDSHVTLKIFNVLAQEVRTLVDSHKEFGEHTVIWDGRDGAGQEVASGLYFCRLKIGEVSKTTKMVIVR